MEAEAREINPEPVENVEHVQADHISIAEGGIGRAEARFIDIGEGGIGLVKAENVAVKEGGIGIAVADSVKLESGSIAFAVAREISGGAHILFDLRAAVLCGVIAGAVIGLIKTVAGHRSA